MNNTNRILLSVFLLLGTIFFSVFLYYIFKEEGLSYKVTTNVSLANARILKMIILISKKQIHLN